MRPVGALQKCKSQALSETRCSPKISQTSTTSLCRKSQGVKGARMPRETWYHKEG